MLKIERVMGFIYLPIHILVLPMAISFAAGWLFPGTVDDVAPVLNMAYYAFGCVFLFAVMFRFLKASFNELLDWKARAVQGVLFGIALYFILLVALSLILNSLSLGASNPNSDEIGREALVNRGAVYVVALVLAPIVEELLFRGVVFGSIRRRSRILAYVVSALVFSFYHVWQYFFFGYDPSLFISVLSYIPPSIALAYCYERSGSIWTSMLLHAAINLFVLSV